jgi:Mrp family chromosome partitioning ATPase/capsular polysaccharide biosynthesis protein
VIDRQRDAATRRSFYDSAGGSSSGGSQGLGRALDVVAARWWVIAAIVVAAVVTALIILPTLPKEYQGRSTLLVEPVPNNDQTLVGLGLPRESSDATREVETVAQLIATPAVAARVKQDLHSDLTIRALLKRVHAVPVAQSNVVAVTANAKSPNDAAVLANAFVQGATEERTARLHGLLDSMIHRIQAHVLGLGPKEQSAAQALATQLQELKTLRGGPDPTLHVASTAQPPLSPVSPHKSLTVVAAALGGLLAGIALLLGGEALAPRIPREEDLRQYRLPILARVPIDRRRPRAGTHAEPLVPGRSSFAVFDAYQLLATAVAASAPPRDDEDRGRVVVVTGPSPSAGKTTTSLHLAAALAQLQNRVLILDADTRHPQLAETLGIQPGKGLETVIRGRGALSRATTNAEFADSVRVLLQERSEASTAPVFTAEVVSKLFASASEAADWVVCDAPPPTYVADGLTLAKHGDFVIFVVRLGRTRERELTELSEMFIQQRIVPLGIVVVGGKRPQPYLIDTSRTASL